MPETDASSIHESVLADECIDALNAGSGGLFVDATLGLGGHSERILKAATNSRVLGIDQDSEAIELASKRLSRFADRFSAVQVNFREVRQVITASGERPNGILADLGVSSLQLDSDLRGFSFRFDAPLDMRMDAASDRETAAELLSRLNQEELADIIYQYGEERASRKIARWIIEKRNSGTPITTTFELADLVKRAVKVSPKERTHPATRTFQALRIAVNDETAVLESFIADAVEILRPDGLLAIITFHSIEDRIVKRAFQRYSGKCECPPRMPVCVCGAVKKVEVLTRKPILPTDAEMTRNPRSRSAKLRVCRKLDL